MFRLHLVFLELWERLDFYTQSVKYSHDTFFFLDFPLRDVFKAEHIQLPITYHMYAVFIELLSFHCTFDKIFQQFHVFQPTNNVDQYIIWGYFRHFAWNVCAFLFLKVQLF